MPYVDSAAAMLAPYPALRLANTGTTESSNAVALAGGRYATLKVGAVAVRIRFLGEGAVSSAVATTDLALNAYERFDWVTQPKKTDFVYIEAADGSTAYEAWVWESSTPV